MVDSRGFFPTWKLRWVIRKNTRHTSREEAIAAKIIEQANPRENITDRFPWGPEEQMILQQLWLHQDKGAREWRDVPIKGIEYLCTTVATDHGDMPVPNAVKEPGTVVGDFGKRLNELTDGEF